MEEKLTPMMKQYQQAKSTIPADAILLFRLGDFYEMFFDDAKKAAPVMELTLTQRAGVPMAGVPYHALDNYLPRLLEAGFKVAIAEQMEDPRAAVGLVKREITKIITPGTITENSALSPKQNNFLIALSVSKDVYGLACLDISTGEFKVTELKSKSDLENELNRLKARECLVSESALAAMDKDSSKPYTASPVLWTPLSEWFFIYDNAADFLQKHFKVASLDGFGCREFKQAVSAAGAVLYYASENLRHNVGHIVKLRTYQNDDYMTVDYISQRNLELVEPLHNGTKNNTLLGVLDLCVTPMGSRLLRDWILRPLYKKDSIAERLDVVEAFNDDPLTLAEIREIAGIVRDLERITARLNIGSANARDMLLLSAGISAIPGLKTLLGNFDKPLISELNSKLHEMPELLERISKAVAEDPPLAITDGGIIREGYNSQLDELRRASTEGKNWIAELQSKEQERSGIKSLKIRFNKVFGYYIELSKSNIALAPQDYTRKQTLANAERFITPELKEVESKILGSEDKAKALEYELFQDLRTFALGFTALIQESAAAIAAVDALSSLAECARKHNYIRPHISEGDLIDIKEGRHPVLDAVMTAERFVPNDVLLDGDENRMMIITGPNMAGKSTYIRQTAMLVLMAQIGSFIPAKSAEIGLVDRIFTRVGAADDISRGQSTFMVEMVETANILNHATSKSLVILDEIGRGTSTFDGLSIAWAVAEYLHDNPASMARTQFATHYHELTELALMKRGVKNYNVAVREYGEQVIFLRQIVPGGTDKSYGIHVARLAGLPREVIKRAGEILENLEINAIADAGQPALINKSREKTSKYKTKKSESAPEVPAIIQPSLFD